MESPTSFDRCIEISETNIDRAVVSREAFRALLDRAAAVARPEEGAPKLLLAIARLATSHCEWLDGELRVEIEGDEHHTNLSIMVDMGAGYRERAFPVVRLQVPVDEFSRAVRLVPRLIEPLQAKNVEGRLVLRARSGSSTLPPPRIEIEALALQAALGARKVPPRPPPARRPARFETKPMDVYTRPTAPRMPAVRPEPASESKETDVDDGWGTKDE